MHTDYRFFTLEMAQRSYGFGVDVVCDGDTKTVHAEDETE